MLKIENIEVFGWEAAIRGMRNPKNSWALSDSHPCSTDICKECECRKTDDYGLPFCSNKDEHYIIGPNDHKLMTTLASAGPVHGKFRRMIVVTMDITAPLYWWKEFDTYKVGTVADSCSTMHKIHAKEFTLDDFSHEHLNNEPLEILKKTIQMLNVYRDAYNNGVEEHGEELIVIAPNNKNIWWQMIQLLPSSYNQKRTVQFNYEVAANIHQYRRHHKLDEWHVLCDTIENLPYSEIILCSEKAKEG